MNFKSFDEIVKTLYEEVIIHAISYKEGNSSYRYINHIIELFDSLKISDQVIISNKPFKKKFKNIKNRFCMLVPLFKYYSMGLWEYIANHEFGEKMLFLVPLEIFIKRDLDIKNMDSKEIVVSEISFSDIYGDAFASSLSPLSIEEQLKLIESVRKNKEFKFKINKIKLKDYLFKSGYSDEQESCYQYYLTRVNHGVYKYGSELLDIMEEFLNYQRGFDKIKRFNFQLMFFDSAMQAMKSTIIKLGEKKVIKALTHENKDENFNLIVFNHKKIKSNLEKRLEIFNELMKKADKEYNKNSEPYFYLIDWMRVNSS